MALGIDVTPAARAAAARRRRRRVLRRCVFDRVPGEGRWRTALLLDGNIGIGGDPVALLAPRSARCSVTTGGSSSRPARPAPPVRVERARLEVDGEARPEFEWQTGRARSAPVAGGRRRPSASSRRWCDDGRWFAVAGRARREPLPIATSRASAPPRVLGIALGVTFTLCFATGLVASSSTRRLVPAGRRGRPGCTGSTRASTSPPASRRSRCCWPSSGSSSRSSSTGRRCDRSPTRWSGCLLPLVGGSLFLLFTGLANINIYRPWHFSFRDGHYATAWIVIGALVVHIGAKLRHHPSGAPARRRRRRARPTGV